MMIPCHMTFLPDLISLLMKTIHRITLAIENLNPRRYSGGMTSTDDFTKTNPVPQHIVTNRSPRHASNSFFLLLLMKKSIKKPPAKCKRLKSCMILFGDDYAVLVVNDVRIAYKVLILHKCLILLHIGYCLFDIKRLKIRIPSLHLKSAVITKA